MAISRLYDRRNCVLNFDNLISVIIPIYNGETYIDSCFEMICNQTYKNIEVIMIDDGSTDTTKEKLQKIAQKDSRIIPFFIDNSGVSAARNFGLKQSRGDYVLFVDVDDYIYPDHIEILYKNLIAYDADISVGNYYKLLISESKPAFNRTNEVFLYTGVEAARAMLYRKKLNGYPVIKLIKKELACSTPFIEEVAYGEDAIFVYDIFLKSKKIVYSPNVIYIYYQQPQSANHTFKAERFQKSWEESRQRLLEDELTKKNGLELAAKSKLFVFACDFCCRLDRESKEDQIKTELVMFIKSNSNVVFRDKNGKLINRIMAGIACISPNLLICVCSLYNELKKQLHFETRKSV